MHVVAFHGDFATPSMLRRDMGVDWVDRYWDYKCDEVDSLRGYEDLVLVAYSRGGATVGKLANTLNNIRAAVLYEAPLLDAKNPAGEFPVLLIWNSLSLRRFTSEAFRSHSEWALKHPVTQLRGRGFHIRLWPPGHGWDRKLNGEIRKWLVAQVL